MKRDHRVSSVGLLLILLILIVFSLFFYFLNNSKKLDQNKELLIQNNKGKDIEVAKNDSLDIKNVAESFGLPIDILSDNATFITFISGDKNIEASAQSQDFRLVSSGGWLPVELLGAGEGSGPISVSASPYFQDNGQPIFFKSDPTYHGELIEYNNSKSYALEKSISEPDASISLWNINNKKVSSVAQCGPACGFSGMYWLSDSKFVVYGIERGYGEGAEIVADSRFVRVYDLSNMSMSSYSDK